MSKKKHQEVQEKAKVEPKSMEKKIFTCDTPKEEKKQFICALHTISQFSREMGITFSHEIFTEDHMGEDVNISKMVVFFGYFRVHGEIVDGELSPRWSVYQRVDQEDGYFDFKQVVSCDPVSLPDALDWVALKTLERKLERFWESAD